MKGSPYNTRVHSPELKKNQELVALRRSRSALTLRSDLGSRLFTVHRGLYRIHILTVSGKLNNIVATISTTAGDTSESFDNDKNDFIGENRATLKQLRLFKKR